MKSRADSTSRSETIYMERIHWELNPIASRSHRGAQLEQQDLFQVATSWLRQPHEDAQGGGKATVRRLDVGRDLGFMMLSILALAEGFRSAVETAEDDRWLLLLGTIGFNFASLEMSAKSRYLA